MLSAALFVFVAAATPGQSQYLDAVDLEAGGDHAAAAQAFMECSWEDEVLAPYARIRAARNFRLFGDTARAHDLLLELAADDDSWVRLSQFELGLLLMDMGDPAHASTAMDNALTSDVELWWFDQYRKQAAELYIKHDDTRAKGMSYFRDVANSTNFIAPRLDAAALLAQSPAAEDRMTAALALVKTKKNAEAANVALTVAPAVLEEPEEIALWRHMNGSLLIADRLSEGAAMLTSVAEDYPDSIWARAALLYLVRTFAWRQRYDEANAALKKLEGGYPDSPEAFQARLSIADSYARNDHYEDGVAAYEALANKYPEHPETPKARLAIGNLHRAKGDIKAALKAYDDLRSTARTADARVDAAFWSAALRESSGDKEHALLDYRSAAEDGITHYFGHRSEALLADKEKLAVVVPVRHRVPESVVLPIPRDDSHSSGASVEDERLERLQFFAMNGLPEAEWEMLSMLTELEGEKADTFYSAIGETGNAYSVMQVADSRSWGANDDGTQSTARLRVRYPRAYWELVTQLSRDFQVDPFLILAVARQESTYRPGLTSSAGAQGVMQVMPPTADWLAKVDPRVDAKDAKNLMRPTHSLKLGAVYLNRMLEKYDGNVVYAAAAYNAGPGNCDKWIRRWGHLSAAEFIEAIPFSETQSYVKRVLANYMTYYSVYPAATAN